MVDLANYTRTGDLDGPLVLTKKHQRRQRDAERTREAVTCATPSLSWTEYAAGAPCPGCGLPYRDAEYWPSKGTMYFTPHERERYDAEEAVYKDRHGRCGSHRHHVSGSLTTHCGKCCPSPPLSPERAQEVSSLLRSMSENRRPEDLMRWSLRLYCGHFVERIAHLSYTDAERAFTMNAKCRECGLDPATIVDARAIGLLAEPQRPVRQAPSRSSPRPTKAALEKRVADLEAELTALKQAGAEKDGKER